MTPRFLAAPLTALILAACSTAPVAPPSPGHLQGDEGTSAAPTKASIPQPVLSAPTLAKPKPAPKVETYSVVVNNVRVQDLLFALARDAKINVDVHPGIIGAVTLNAIDQTLQQILTGRCATGCGCLRRIIRGGGTVARITMPAPRAGT